MTQEQTTLLSLIVRTAETGVLRRLVLSQPNEDAPAPRQSGKVCLVRGGRVLMMESAFADGRVAQKLYTPKEIPVCFPALLSAYRQVNLLSSAGDAELRVSRKGKVTLLGAGKLSAALAGAGGETLPRFDLPPDREKKHLLSGEEPFLFSLGISDKNGRVHDKRQAKFRQINRFLDYLADVYDELPPEGTLTVLDLCCGKSYLSFAVYHYLSALRGRQVDMLGVDRKADVMADCEKIAATCGFSGMRFLAGDIRTAVPPSLRPDLVISLHACDTATDLVLRQAVALRARVILSTPCCHRQLSRDIRAKELAFVTDYPQLRGKLCEALTDGLRLLALECAGYAVQASELTDPENTPKNTLLRAVLRKHFDPDSAQAQKKQAEYRAALAFLLGKDVARYPEEP